MFSSLTSIFLIYLSYLRNFLEITYHLNNTFLFTWTQS